MQGLRAPVQATWALSGGTWRSCSGCHGDLVWGQGGPSPDVRCGPWVSCYRPRSMHAVSLSSMLSRLNGMNFELVHFCQHYFVLACRGSPNVLCTVCTNSPGTGSSWTTTAERECRYMVVVDQVQRPSNLAFGPSAKKTQLPFLRDNCTFRTGWLHPRPLSRSTFLL